jgi:hypothetical protein
MEDKILIEILRYFNGKDEEDSLFSFPAFELFFKYCELFKLLRNEIKFNLESAKKDDKYNYINNLKEKLFTSYSEDKFKNSKYYNNNSVIILQNYSKYDSDPLLNYKLSFSHIFFDEEAEIYSKQSEFIETVKNHLLYELIIYINSIDLNNNLKRQNYSKTYLKAYCKIVSEAKPLRAFTFNYYRENIVEHYSNMFKEEFVNNSNNFKKYNDFNFDEYIEECLKDLKSSREKVLGIRSNDENYFDNKLLLNTEGINEILSSHKFLYDDDPDFYFANFLSGYNNYCLIVEADKMIKFITNQSSEIIRIVPPVIPAIFKSEKGFSIFNYILNELDINVLTIDNRSNQTYLNAFWHSSKAKEEIFKIQMSMNDYLKYLNQIFNKKYKSRTMSNGINKVDIIEDYISKFKIN